jgi:uncharacterized protein YdeI (YjbR/CyaY-like superfamily)
VRRPTRSEVTVFATAAEFRSWLERNHATASDVWVAYYRRGAAKPAMTYPESVDQALCFGWIDSITYRVDDELTATRFTPRRSGSNWSSVNVAKVAALRAAGLMTEAGQRAFDARRPVSRA